MSGRDYTNAAQQRILQLIAALGGAMFNGLSNGDLAKLLNTQPSNVVRDLANAKTAGWVEQIAETGRWRLAVKPVQIFRTISQEMQRQREKLDELEARYTRLPE